MTTLILMTSNERKQAEYQRFFAPFNIDVVVRPHQPEMVTTWLAQPGVRIAIKDESNLWTADHGLVPQGHTGPVLNICKVEAWVCSQGQIEHRRYSGLVEGTVEQHTTSDTEEVFGWDGCFKPHHLGRSFHEMSTLGLKCSAREEALSQLADEFLQYRQPKELRWSRVEVTGAVDLSVSVAEFVCANPYLNTLPRFLWNLTAQAVNSGCHFRRTTNRRIGNYWHPGLNSGIPFTPKKDPIHEITYLFHDLTGHHTLPDLIYGGEADEVSRMVYLVSRLMSEAWSLVLADMLFVDDLRSWNEYDWAKRKIWPLYDENRSLATTELLWRMTRYVCLGDDQAFPDTPAFQAFRSKYNGFFTADWQWSTANWEALAQRQDTHRRWVDMVGANRFTELGLETLQSCQADMGLPTGVSLEKVVQEVFKHHLPKVLACDKEERFTINLKRSNQNAHRRYFLGQSMAYARHSPVVPTMAGWDHLLSEDLNPVVARAVFDTYLGVLKDLHVISPEDRRVYTEVYPHFAPVFVSYDNENGSIAEVLDQVFKEYPKR